LSALVLMGAGLGGVLLLDRGTTSSFGPIVCMTLLIVGCNALIAVLLPYAAESYPLAVRGQATGWIAACTKFGGLGAQVLGLTGLVPALGQAATGIAVLVILAMGLATKYCGETRGRSLAAVEPQ
jgi:putative MFS transporter